MSSFRLEELASRNAMHSYSRKASSERLVKLCEPEAGPIQANRDCAVGPTADRQLPTDRPRWPVAAARQCVDYPHDGPVGTRIPMNGPLPMTSRSNQVGLTRRIHLATAAE